MNILRQLRAMQHDEIRYVMDCCAQYAVFGKNEDERSRASRLYKIAVWVYQKGMRHDETA